MRNRILSLALVSAASTLYLATGCQPKADVVIKTSEGDIAIDLYDDTPKHKENFLKLAREKFYNGTEFHRVIKGFVIQGGDPYSKDSTKRDSLGLGEPGYKLDAEIRPTHIHKRGALAAARQGDEQNPFLRSSGSQFYIVTGTKIPADSVTFFERIPQKQDYVMRRDIIDALSQNTNEGLRDSLMRSDVIIRELLAKKDTASAMAFNQSIQARMQPIVSQVQKQPYKPFAYTEEQRKAYINEGGTPALDAGYTVFGEVVSGMDIVDKIAAIPTDPRERPTRPIKVLEVVVND